MSKPIIEIKNFSYSYEGAEEPALKNINVTINNQNSSTSFSSIDFGFLSFKNNVKYVSLIYPESLSEGEKNYKIETNIIKDESRGCLNRQPLNLWRFGNSKGFMVRNYSLTKQHSLKPSPGASCTSYRIAIDLLHT